MRFNRSKYYIITGLLSILPITATYWIVAKLFQFFSKPGKAIVNKLFKHKIHILESYLEIRVNNFDIEEDNFFHLLI